MDKYFRTLELKPGASESQIKNAYRALARKYHPDVNPASDAHERFIEIAEAYEVLKEGKSVKTSQYDWGFDEEEILRQNEELRRQRAREYARMSYENFKKTNEAFAKSWYFQPVKMMVQGMVAFAYALAILFFLSPLLGYLIWGSQSFMITIFMLLFSSHVYRAARDLHRESKPYFKNY